MGIDCELLARRAAERAEREKLKHLIDASSLGTPAAKAYRRRAQRDRGLEGAQKLIDEAAAYERAHRKLR